MESVLTKIIRQAVQSGRPARIPFLTAGCPDLEGFWKSLKELDDNGADIIEIGVPFSDPVADGPVVALASQKALEIGVNLKWILDGLGKVKLKAPVVLMSYANPLLQYAWEDSVGETLEKKSRDSLERLAKELGRISVAGVIVPDVPLEESGAFRDAFKKVNIDLVSLVGPNTTEERMKEYAEVSRGYVYVISVLGTTGVREGLPPEVTETLARARKAFSLPLALGFGLSHPSQLAGIANPPDAVIFGSALIRHLTAGGAGSEFMKPWVK